MHENQQPPEKAVRVTSYYDPVRHELSVHSVFHTIQGEGPFAGRPAIFVRLAGCNLQCTFCDTDYTSKRENMGPDALVSHMLGSVAFGEATPDLVVITGGEPFRQQIGPFVRKLVGLGFHVQIETNGTLHVNDFPWDDAWPGNRCQFVTVVCSPKTGKVNEKLAPFITAYKYVVEDGCIDPDDGLPVLALRHPAAPRVARPHATFTGTVYVQPIDVQDAAQNAAHLAAAVRSCMKFGHTLCLQTHKIIGME